ncbi:MAG: WbqC family protein [Saprospiraceae bacterium]|nr:WbqC family protein [Saprospiraceae bacterium]
MKAFYPESFRIKHVFLDNFALLKSEMDINQQNYQNILIESQIFPPIQSIAYMVQSTNTLIEVHEHYQKRSFRNRYQIGSSQGRHELSIPLKKGKNHQMPIQEVQIAYDSNWQHNHIKAIQSSYGKSAYFIYYIEFVRELLFTDCYNLLELNFNSLKLISALIQFQIPFQRTSSFQKNPEKEITDLRSMMLPGTIHQFKNPAYYQVYTGNTGFLQQLSVLDLIFHLGPEAVFYLQQMKI